MNKIIQNKINLFMFIGIVFGILIEGILINLQFTKESVWNDEFICDLMLEQRVGCYKGCQMYTQSEDMIDEKYDNYNNCIDKCQQNYYLEFDEKGHISYCEYNH